jgi:hypothetical protein
VSLDCELISQRADFPESCLATDLSTTGIWLATHHPVRAGEQVVVCFEPNDGWSDGELIVFAEVARVITTRRGSGGGGMGLEFVDLSGLEQATLTEWLARRKMPVPRRRRPMPRVVPPPAGPVSFRPPRVWR